MLLEIAALLDRHDAAVERMAGAVADSSGEVAAKLAVLREALAVLAAERCDGARTVKLLDVFARV